MKKLLAILLMLSLISCVTTKNFESNLNSWVGHNINDLIKAEGYPSGSFVAPNGNNVYIYSTSSSFTMPTTTYSSYNAYGNSIYGTSTTSGGQTLNSWCTAYLEVNKKNIIVNWSWKGNHCAAYKQHTM